MQYDTDDPLMPQLRDYLEMVRKDGAISFSLQFRWKYDGAKEDYENAMKTWKAMQEAEHSLKTQKDGQKKLN